MISIFHLDTFPLLIYKARRPLVPLRTERNRKIIGVQIDQWMNNENWRSKIVERHHMISISTGGVDFSSELRVYCIIIRGSKKAEHNDEENDKRRVQ